MTDIPTREQVQQALHRIAHSNTRPTWAQLDAIVAVARWALPHLPAQCDNCVDGWDNTHGSNCLECGGTGVREKAKSVSCPVTEAMIEETILALEAATTIGQRSCSPGDHLNYANHDRLVRLLRAALEDNHE